MAFLGGLSGNLIHDNVRYDLKILDAKRGAVYEKSDLLAKGGTDNQIVTFPRNETYHIEVSVKALMRERQTPDTIRKGITRGIVVVPDWACRRNNHGTVLCCCCNTFDPTQLLALG